MSDNKSNGNRFSAYWLYGVLLLILIGFNYYSGASFWSQPKEIPQSKFEEYLSNGDVAKIIILNRKEANVYLTEDALKKRRTQRGENLRAILLCRELMRAKYLNIALN